jgi:hypothetical protein
VGGVPENILVAHLPAWHLTTIGWAAARGPSVMHRS